VKIVVKLGGEIMLNSAGLDALAADIASLANQGHSLLVVHGGGPQADALSSALGYPIRKVAGRRITDDNALEVARMVYGGSTNLDLLSALLRHDARPVGLSGVDAATIVVTRRPPTRIEDPSTGTTQTVDFGHVGDISHVNPALLDLLIAHRYIPVVASLAADTSGNLYNVNADTIAQSLAVALPADRLVLVTNVPGILRDPDDPSTLIEHCTLATLRDLISTGAISGGMLPKAHNIIEAITSGVPTIQIIDGTRTPSLLLDAVAGKPAGTLITTH
jgi:acetylglutamate kinase